LAVVDHQQQQQDPQVLASPSLEVRTVWHGRSRRCVHTASCTQCRRCCTPLARSLTQSCALCAAQHTVHNRRVSLAVATAARMWWAGCTLLRGAHTAAWMWTQPSRPRCLRSLAWT
jgi:hypothetical protein